MNVEDMIVRFCQKNGIYWEVRESIRCVTLERGDHQTVLVGHSCDAIGSAIHCHEYEILDGIRDLSRKMRGAAIVVGSMRERPSVHAKPTTFTPFGFSARRPDTLADVAFAVDGISRQPTKQPALVSAETHVYPKPPALVPSTSGYRPAGENWVPKAELESVKHELADWKANAKALVEGRAEANGRANKLADEAGNLRHERDELLRENAVLRRDVERLERKMKR